MSGTPNKRVHGVLAAAALAALALASLLLTRAGTGDVGGVRAEAQGQERPNVLILMTDDQTLESMRVMPNVGRLLGAQGTTFDNAFVSFSLCCPSRATLLTGQYAHNHGVFGNHPPDGGYAQLDTTNWLPLWLQRAGYRTIHLGKFLNGYGSEDQTEVPPGWDEWYGSIDPSSYQYYGYTLNENGTLVTYGADGDPAFYQTDFYAHRAAALIARSAASPQPFFLSVGFLAPHQGGPHTPDDPPELGTPDPAPRHRDRFALEPLAQAADFNELDVSDKPQIIRERPAFDASQIAVIRENYQQRLESLLAVDEAIAQILEALRQTGELGNTLIIFTSDNGFFHGEHRVPAGKVLAYEPSIRVPLILSGPGVPRGARRHQLVTNTDLAPTILEAANAQPGRVQDGRSLFPLLRDPGLEWDRDLLIEGGEEGLRGQTQPFVALRTPRYVYVEYANRDQELYDLPYDPLQLESRHADPEYAAVREELARRLAALRNCAGPTCSTKPSPDQPAPAQPPLALHSSR